MKPSRPFAVVLVASTGHALLVEKILLNAGLACKLIPVPRQVSSDCGVCVSIDPRDQARAFSICVDRGAAIEGIRLIES